MDYAQARHFMIEGQIRPNKVVDLGVLEAMARLPRERFVPRRLKGMAYVDEDLDLGSGRALMEPMVLARLLQAAEITRDDVVLVIGTGSGYEATVAATLAQTVLTLDSDSEQQAQVEALAHALDIVQLATVTGDIRSGVPDQAPFNVIMVNGAMAELPATYAEQLDNGGRLVGVLRPAGGVGRATLWQKVHGVVAARPLFDANTPYLGELAPVNSFQF